MKNISNYTIFLRNSRHWRYFILKKNVLSKNEIFFGNFIEINKKQNDIVLLKSFPCYFSVNLPSRLITSSLLSGELIVYTWPRWFCLGFAWFASGFLGLIDYDMLGVQGNLNVILRAGWY